MQELGREVGAVGPHQGVEFGMNGELLEVGRVPQRFEDRPAQGRTEINFTRRAVAEAQPDDAAAHVLGFQDVVVHLLLQRGNAIQRLSRARQAPVLQQFLPVQGRPVKHQAQGARRKVSVHGSRFDLDRDFIFPVRRMEVTRVRCRTCQ